MNICNNCASDKIKALLNLGSQPISNRFLIDSSDPKPTYQLAVNQCFGCGLVQINNPVSVSEIVPRFGWITYNEPEAHLDQLVEKISSLEGLSKESTICGITFKDDSTLNRFQAKGFKNVWRIDKQSDLGIDNPKTSLETIQQYINPDAIASVVARRGLADVVIVRHILEHAHNARQFIAGIKKLVKPNGYIIFEVPDCAEAFEQCDYTTLWEEHTLYFTAQTFKNFFPCNGFNLVDFECYPNVFENSLVAITQLNEAKDNAIACGTLLNDETKRIKNFSDNFPKYLQEIQSFLSKCKNDKGKIAIFGAGHLACTFVSLFGLEKFIDFCVDDNPNKVGLYLAGTQLPIYRSKALIEENVKVCLLTLNPINEDKIISINSEFIDKGGLFLSIFPTSKRAVHKNF